MNRVLSLAASTMLLAVVMTSGAISGSLPYTARPAVLSPPFATAAAPDTLLVGLRPAPAHSFNQPSESSLITRMFATLGVRSAEQVFASVGGAHATQPTETADLRRIYRIRLVPGTDRGQAEQALRANPLVAFAEPDYQAQITAAPSDPRYPEQWALAALNAPTAWDVTTGSGNVTIAVIDSGIDTAHADLAGQLWVNPGEIPANGIDDDNNGHIDDLNGWNFLGNNADLSDTTGHGTQVAGVLAAAANNSSGGAGICWGCKLMIVKVTQTGGVANYSDIAAGVLYAAQKGAKIINLSLGGTSDSATLRAAITVAAQTAVIVGGAGNSGSAAPFYPAAYDDAVLAVAGTTQADTKVATSNYGAWVDISAPGENILTTFSGGGYGAASGTSVAAPFAAGVAGLLLSQHPDWSPAQARAQIANTALAIDHLNPGLSGQLGSGRLDAGAALTRPATPALAITGYSLNGQPSARPEPGSTVDLLVTLANRGNNATNIQATLSASGVSISQPSGSFGALPTFRSSANAVAFRFTAASGYNTPMSFTLHVAADGGYVADLPLTILTSPGIVNVPATITNQTWAADRTYLINQDSGVPAGATLTIQPGTVVRFAPNTSLSIAGTLIADGTPAQPIRFTRQGAGGSWGQIKFLDSSADASFDQAGSYTSGSILRSAIIEYGQGINLTTASPYIANNTFREIASGPMMPGLSASAISGSPGPRLVIASNTFSNTGIGLSGSYPNGQLAVLGNQLSGGTIQIGGPSDGATTIAANTVTNSIAQNLAVVGISASGTYTITANRVTGGSIGISVGNSGMMYARSGLLSGNLVSSTSDDAIFVTPLSWGVPVTTTLIQNTIIVEHGAGIGLNSSGGNLVLHANNLIAAPGAYAVRLPDTYSQNVDATGNWWGTTDPGAIQAAIYDGNDKFGIGFADASSPLAVPDQNAPAYVQHVAVGPDSTLGIQTGTFEVQFSRPMDHSTNPIVAFAQAKRGTWSMFPLPDFGMSNSTGMNTIRGIATAPDGISWFATNYGLASFDGTTWKTFSTMDPLPPNNMPIGGLSSIVIDRNGYKWVGGSYGLARFDGTNWKTYPFQGGANVPSGIITSLALDRDGSLWFTTGPGGGIGRFDGANWRFYRNADAGFTINESRMLTVDHNGVKWFTASNAAGGGVGRFDGNIWTFYTPTNSGLPESYVNGIAADNDGSVWFASGAALARFDGNTWTTYRNPTSASGLGGLAIDTHGVKWATSTMEGGAVSFDGTSWKNYPVAPVTVPPTPSVMFTDARMTIGSDGNKWFGSYSPNGNAYVLWGGDDYPLVSSAQWLDDHTWRATYDITSLIPRGAQSISVGGARDIGGMEIAPDSRFGFTVDYAGTISDRTPPSSPRVFATGIPGDPSSVRITWSASDSESGIVAYRYAIGSAPGATDVVNWTAVGVGQAAQATAVTSSTSSGITRAGLGLADGQVYWVSVQAQNSSGLWSPSQYGSFVAGQQTIVRLYIALSQR